MVILSKELGSRVIKWFNRVYATLVIEDIPYGFRSHVFGFRAFGIWPSVDDSPSYKWLTIASFSTLGIVSPLSLFVNIFYASSIEEAMDHSFFPLICVVDALKAAVVYWRSESIRDAFRIHEKLLNSAGSDTANHNRIARINFLVNMIFSLIYSLTTVMVAIQIMFSASGQGIFRSTSMWPFELAQMPVVYYTVLVFQLLCGLGVDLWAAMADSFFFALINMTCGHVAELKERLIRMGDGDDRYAGVDDRNLVFYKDLMECCRRYEDCLSLAATVNKILSPAFLGQFGISGLVLCSTVFILSMNNPLDNPVKFMTIMVYLVAVITQILPNCYFGSRLSHGSDGITNAIYASQWMDRNEKCKRAIRILTERSMRPMTIYAGGLFELSLPTFVKICRAAYSYFNLLRRLDSKMI